MRLASTAAGGAVIGAIVDGGLVANAADSEMVNVPVAGVESSVSDTAQQLSAWACVATLSALEPGSVDPCMGQTPLPEQQARRSSGVGCQPAHSAHPAAPSERTTTSAAVRLNSSSTPVGCMVATRVSMKWRTGPAQFPGLNCAAHVGTLGVESPQTLTAGVASPEAVR